MFAHPTCSPKIPLCLAGMGIWRGLSTMPNAVLYAVEDDNGLMILQAKLFRLGLTKKHDSN